jgi:hypothetical protein
MSKNAFGLLVIFLYALLLMSGCGDGGGAVIDARATTAKAGLLQNVAAGNTIFLDASQSTSTDGGPLTYQWVLVSKPQGSAANISNPTLVNASFQTDLPGQYTVKLIVSDASSKSSEDSVTLTAVPSGATAPVANAGAAQSVVVGSLVTLDGNNSSASSSTSLSYSWTLNTRPAGSAAVLSGATSASPTFTADAAGTYALSLVVNDGKTSSGAATVTVTALPAQIVPVANAGGAQLAVVGALVALNGSNSTAASGGPLTYKWVMSSRPSGSAAQLSSTAVARPSFTPDVIGPYNFKLTVDDGIATSAAATVTVTADALVSISIAPLDQKLLVGQSSRYIATGVFATAGTQDISTSVTWYSFNEAVATIDATGVVTVSGQGTTVISAALLGKSASTTLTIDPSALLGIRVDKGPAFTLALGKTVQLVATATYSDKTKKDVTQLATWALSYAGGDCLAVSDAAGTKGLVTSLGSPGYRALNVTYGGMKTIVGISTN